MVWTCRIEVKVFAGRRGPGGKASTGVLGKELAHRHGDLLDVGFQREVPGIQELDGGVGIVSFECFCA